MRCGEGSESFGAMSRRSPRTKIDSLVTIEAKFRGKVDALLDACENGDVKCVCALLDDGLDVNVKDEKKQSALVFAAAAGHVAVVDLLLARGADVNVRDAFFRGTPLHFAAYNDHEELSVLLALHGADLDAKNKFKNTPLQVVGGSVRIPLTVDEKELRRKRLLDARVVYLERMRRERNWRERCAFILVLSGCGFKLGTSPKPAAGSEGPLPSVRRDKMYLLTHVFMLYTGRRPIKAAKVCSVTELIVSFL